MKNFKRTFCIMVMASLLAPNLLSPNQKIAIASTITYQDREARNQRMKEIDQHKAVQKSQSEKIAKEEVETAPSEQVEKQSPSSTITPSNTVKVPQNNGNGNLIIKDNDYFRDFVVEGPELRIRHGELGDLAKTSSWIDYACYYSLRSDSEFISINVSRIREATAFGSDTSSSLFVTYNLKFNPHVSKKRLPKIEVNTKTGPKLIDFKKISDYSNGGFNIRTGDDSFLERFYYPGCDANLLLENTKGEILRVPLSAELLEQWHQIGKANLRKIKKDYEES